MNNRKHQSKVPQTMSEPRNKPMIQCFWSNYWIAFQLRSIGQFNYSPRCAPTALAANAIKSVISLCDIISLPGPLRLLQFALLIKLHSGPRREILWSPPSSRLFFHEPKRFLLAANHWNCKWEKLSNKKLFRKIFARKRFLHLEF